VISWESVVTSFCLCFCLLIKQQTAAEISTLFPVIHFNTVIFQCWRIGNPSYLWIVLSCEVNLGLNADVWLTKTDSPHGCVYFSLSLMQTSFLVSPANRNAEHIAAVTMFDW